VYGTLIQRVTWIAGVAREAIQRLSGVVDCDVSELEHYVPIVERIIYQSEKRVLEGVKLAAEEKVYSLFEEHTELLKRGKAGKPVEFGHKVLVAQSEEKFITHYAVFPKREEDKDLVAGTLAAHEALFGDVPSVLAADKGFYESREQLSELGERIETVSIAKKGSRTAEEKERESTGAFKEGQRFRAGSEGSISVLKRAFKLNRCLFKGFRNYAASVGCAVFCHNLVLLTRL
jgi:IS5 family transposase